jgi:hypothetical protein
MCLLLVHYIIYIYIYIPAHTRTCIHITHTYTSAHIKRVPPAFSRAYRALEHANFMVIPHCCAIRLFQQGVKQQTACAWLAEGVVGRVAELLGAVHHCAQRMEFSHMYVRMYVCLGRGKR